MQVSFHCSNIAGTTRDKNLLLGQRSFGLQYLHESPLRHGTEMIGRDGRSKPWIEVSLNVTFTENCHTTDFTWLPSKGKAEV